MTSNTKDVFSVVINFFIQKFQFQIYFNEKGLFQRFHPIFDLLHQSYNKKIRTNLS